MSTRAEQLKAKAEALARKKAEKAEPKPTAPAAPETPASADTVTAADRKRHLAPVSAPHVKPIRTTVDLSPTHHAQMKAWEAETAVMLGLARVTRQDVLRVMVKRLLTDETLARMIRADLREETGT